MRFNGRNIHDNVELGLRKGAAKRLGDAATGPIMPQEHGSIHQFRNIWIVARDDSRE
jgi:3-keto-disaccharide hydrolase